MNSVLNRSELLAEGFEPVERDDRLLDVFSKETPEKGVTLWVKFPALSSKTGDSPGGQAGTGAGIRQEAEEGVVISPPFRKGEPEGVVISPPSFKGELEGVVEIIRIHNHKESRHEFPRGEVEKALLQNKKLII